jgi:hypothetical protein
LCGTEAAPSHQTQRPFSGLRRGLLIDKAARISDGAKGAEALDHPLTSLDRRAESLRSRLEVFGKKNLAKKFLGSFVDFALTIADHLLRFFPEKKSLKSGRRERCHARLWAAC